MSIRILVVDDEVAVRRVVERALSRSKHDVLLAASGEEACELLERHTVDMVLIDLNMPGMSGATLYHVIATQWPVLSSRVIVMTGEVDGRSHDAWITLNRLPRLQKPFGIHTLLEYITQLLPDQPREANGG